jgi:histidinol-phosphate phosphatase family protein
MGVRPLKLQKAVFFDRDGVIIQQVDFLIKPGQLKLLPDVGKVIKVLNHFGFLAVVITNQPVVARGLIKPEGIDKIHSVLINRLKKRGAKIDAVYFCPHHPNATLKKYRKRCRCRKPEPGMILKAARDLNINLKKSFMVGDALIDIVAGKRAGLTSILVKTGPGHSRLDKLYKKNFKPDFIVKNLTEVVRIIKKYGK